MSNNECTLSGKNILITGGSMGIGFASAIECARMGANLTICARNRPEIDSALSQLRDMFPNLSINGISADVTDLHQIERVIDLLEESHGPLNGVIHSAGVYGPIGRITDVNPEEWLEALKINLYGTFLVTRQAIKRMQNNNTRGRIALFSGGGAATPFPNFTSYASSKVGVVRFSESVALEYLDENISINAIAPGFVATRLHQQTVDAGPTLAGKSFYDQTLEKITSSTSVLPEVGGKCASFLMSDLSDGITGKFIAAPYDNYRVWMQNPSFNEDPSLFTLRRMVPRDRGLNWQ